MTLKICRTCKVEKQVSEYYKSQKIKCGYEGTCKACKLEQKRKAYAEDPEKFLERRRKWGEANEEYWRQYNHERHKRYYPANKDKYRARGRVNEQRRNARKLQRTPAWLTEEHHQQIKAIYTHARDCEMVSGERYHVDHIIPLQGKNVCGLHVPWNLQVLPADINQRKSNRYDPSQELSED